MRPGRKALAAENYTFQSTHPLRGATQPETWLRRHERNFNPRTPCGVRPITRRWNTTKKAFQSTHPLRGATIIWVPNEKAANISIHAPLAGCDSLSNCARIIGNKFQSTHPLRGATRRSMASRTRLYFNPRTPCGVRRGYQRKAHRFGFISIHAPLAGCDLLGRGNQGVAGKFQSTHPLRGATEESDAQALRTQISIHAPLAGCDSETDCSSSGRYLISIHAPLAGCDYMAEGLGQGFDKISIHAPLAGCDVCDALRHRVREISIHAPLAGCDLKNLIHTIIQIYFNPRTPCGVRPTEHIKAASVNNFNPRTPCGVRQIIH